MQALDTIPTPHVDWPAGALSSAKKPSTRIVWTRSGLVSRALQHNGYKSLDLHLDTARLLNTWRTLTKSSRCPLIFRSLKNKQDQDYIDDSHLRKDDDDEVWYYLSNMEPQVDVLVFLQLDGRNGQESRVVHCAAQDAFFDRARQQPLWSEKEPLRTSIETRVIELELKTEFAARMRAKAAVGSHFS